jgi:hypothetical protein
MLVLVIVDCVLYTHRVIFLSDLGTTIEKEERIFGFINRSNAVM